MAGNAPSDQRPQATSDDRIYRRSADTARRATPRSLPNIKLAPFEQHAPQRTYLDLYAESSYSSDSDSDAGGDAAIEDHASAASMSPIEAVVLGFEHSAPRLPALRIGAARLSEMVHACHRPPPPTNVDNASNPKVLANTRDIAAPVPADIKDSQPLPEVQFTQQTLENDADGAAAFLPKRLTRASVRHKHADAASLSPTECGSQASDHDAPALLDFAHNEDSCNGLLAPGAFGDEKQRARADGSLWQRALCLMRGNRREREAKLFKPVVTHPGTRNQTADDQELWPDRDADRIMSKFPFCCCAARYCVAFTFVAIIVAAIIGFFAWPRVPTLSISSLTAQAPARITLDPRRSLYGLHMPLRITYEIHSGNFYPLQIRSARVRGFDGVTGNRIIDTKLHRIPVTPLRMQFHSADTAIDYLTSDSADPALTDLFGKCAPRSARVAHPDGRPGALTIRFQITVEVGGLGWLKQPVVTLNQKVECPE